MKFQLNEFLDNMTEQSRTGLGVEILQIKGLAELVDMLPLDINCKSTSTVLLNLDQIWVIITKSDNPIALTIFHKAQINVATC